MKPWLPAGIAIALSLLITGCATSTVDTRKQEKYSAYSSLAPEQRQLVDRGEIKVGMTMDAVYIAWGKPSQRFSGESSSGATTTWIYHGTYTMEYRYWTHRPMRYRDRFYPEPFLETEFVPRDYLSAEVVFQDGLVKEWRSLPRPPR